VSYEDIKVKKGGRIATIIVDRPNVLNATRHETMLEIDRALDDIEADENIWVIVLTGGGEKAFISGGDISAMASDPLWADKATKGQEVCTRIEFFPKPVIARINGIALGAGIEIAMCCDIRIAAETAIMGQPEVRLGIIPGYGATQRLPRLVGMGKAKELILMGLRINAPEALRIGLVNQVVPVSELDNAVTQAAEKLLGMGPVALHMAKTAMNYGNQADLRTGLAMEARCYSHCFRTEDRVEGVNAFLEKRRPQFKGK
jgi:enoyl-CoA hydratase